MPETRLKRTVKCSVSALVWTTDWIADQIGLSSRSRRQGVVLLYHDVSQRDLPSFARQMDELQMKNEVVPLNEIRTHRRGTNDRRLAVAITFDDALVSFSERVAQVLRDRKLPATLFVPSALVTEGGDGVHMTRSDLASLPGNIEIASHSRLHLRLTELTDSELFDETSGSKVELEAVTSKHVESFAFPFGDWDAKVERVVRSAGYTELCSVRPSCVRADISVLPRVTLEPFDTPIEFRLKVAGAYRWMGTVMAARQRFLGHSV